MRRPALILAALSLASAAGAMQTERFQALTPKAGAQISMEVVSGVALVRFSTGTTAAEEQRIAAQAGATVTDQLSSGWTVVSLSSGMTVSAGVRLLASLPGVASAAPDHAYRPVRIPSDPLFPSQTSLNQLDMPAAWEFDTGGTNKVTIAVIDTGIEGTHPDLNSKLVDVSTPSIGSQYFNPDAGGAQSQDSLPTTACQHGTQTSGVAAAAANNGQGVAGVSWGAQLISLRVFNPNDCNADCSDKLAPGSCSTDDITVDKAINYVKGLEGSPALGKIVVSMSLGAAGKSCATGDGTAGPGVLLGDMSAAVTAGIPFAIAAGNEGNQSNGIDEPANCAGTGAAPVGIVPVGAVDSGDNIAYFTNGGPELAAHGVVAPGVNVETTNIGASYTGSATGTSFSTPHVAGVMALILSAKPTTTPGQIETILRGGAQNIGASSVVEGAGRVNAFRTMKLAVQGTLAGFAGDQKAIAFPNPFRVSQAGEVTITIPISLQGAGPTIKIYTASGEFVRQLTGLTWDGKNNGGSYVASGTYIFEVSTAAGHTTGRLAVIR